MTRTARARKGLLGNRRSFVLVLAAAGLTACGSSTRVSLAGDDDDSSPGSSSPANVTALVSEPRVDLPGRISVFLRVENVNGTPAADLTGDDFEIYENDSLVSTTESFQRIRSQPQVFRSYMHLILDRSNSVQAGNAADVQAGAASFIDVVTAQESNFIKISWFDGSPTLHAIAGHDIGFSNDRAALLAAIDALNDEPPFSPSTNLYGAVIGGIEDLDDVDAEAAAEGVEYRSLALVTFTDGTHQSGPTPTLEQAVMAIETPSAGGIEHSSFTIGVGSEIDPTVLQMLGPNGAVAAANFPVLSDAFAEVGDSVRRLANSFYNLTYCSPKTSGTNNVLRVAVRNAPANSEEASFEFDATGFGAGCAFLDVRSHEELAEGSARAFMTDAVELTDGSVVGVGWRGSGCVEPGCTQPATAYVTRFNASSATATEEEARSDGRMDMSFGAMGIVELEGPGFATSGATSVLHDSANGRLLIGGWSRETSGSGATVASIWSIDDDGQSAPTRVDLAAIGSEDEGILDLAMLPSGDIVASGFRGATDRQYMVWRMFPNLMLDTGFGTDGVAVHPMTPTVGHGGADAIALDNTGRIYAVGEADGGVRAVAFDVTSGALVAGFGGTGVVDAARTIGATTFDALLGDAVCDGDNLVIGGTLVRPVGASGVDEQPAVWRILPDGAMDPQFTGSVSSPTHGQGVVTLRNGSTNNPIRDFGNDTRIEDVVIAPDGSILAAGYRWNDLPTSTPSNTDMVQFSFNETGILRSAFNLVGFVIDDGASGDDSFERGTVVRVLSSGAVWTMGVSNPTNPDVGVNTDVPTVWVDRDPARVFAPLATTGG